MACDLSEDSIGIYNTSKPKSYQEALNDGVIVEIIVDGETLS